jgi:hypothetical protein
MVLGPWTGACIRRSQPVSDISRAWGLFDIIVKKVHFKQNRGENHHGIRDFPVDVDR